MHFKAYISIKGRIRQHSDKHKCIMIARQDDVLVILKVPHIRKSKEITYKIHNHVTFRYCISRITGI